MKLLFALAFPILLVAQDHAGHYTPEAIERGSRLFGLNCSFCHGANGDAVAGVDLKTGRFRHATSDEEVAKVIATGVPGTAMPPHRLSDLEISNIIAFIRNMREFNSASVTIGDAARGKSLFAANCVQCHRIDGAGGRSGPDLSDIGAIRAANSMERTLLDPTANMLPQNRAIRAVTKSGQTITGRRLNEDSFTVQVIDAQEKLVSLDKSQLREYTVLKTSPMPAYKDKLSPQQIGDLIGYMLTLKGAN